MSTYSDEGTIAHALAAMCLTDGTNAAAYIGRVIESEDYEHASLSPSGAHRWMRCAGSHALEASSRVFVPRKFSLAVTEDMAAGVQTYLDNVREYAAAPGATLLIEQKLPVDHLTGEEGATGSGDAVIILPVELQMHDLKMGYTEVDPEDNEQLFMYASGALREFGDFIDDLTDDFVIRLVIHQPRKQSAPKEWDCTVRDLRAFEEECKEAARVAIYLKNYNAVEQIESLTPGAKQCKFCEAKPCKALDKFVQDEIGASFDVIADTKAGPAIVNTLVPTDDVMLATKMKACDLIEDWIKAIRAKVESELFAGKSVPGYKLVQGKRGNRAWRNATEAETTLKSMRLKVEQMYDFTLISPTTAEKLLKTTPKRWKRLEPLIGQSDGKPSVAPESDKRPALVIESVEDGFVDLTQTADDLL